MLTASTREVVMFQRLKKFFSAATSGEARREHDVNREHDINEVGRLVAAGAVVIDVREPSEFAQGSVPGARNIPLGELASRLADIPKDATIACLCRSGARSGRAQDFLREQGYDAVNLTGGMLAWRGK